MKIKYLFIFSVIISAILLNLRSLTAETGEDLSNRIVLDGYSQDFTPDEALFIKEPLDSCQESNDDSWWGEYNDVKQIKLTWDTNNLYIAVDACCRDNNVIFFLDIFDDYGIHDMLDLNTWMRAFKFYGTNPDFFLATWDTNDNPQFWMMESGSNLQANEVTIEDFSAYNTGNLGRSMEAAIPWEVIYYDSTHSMENFPELRMMAVITTGSDNLGGPDVIPNNLGGMPSDGTSLAILDNYVKIWVDSTGNGEPDMNISPRARVNFFKTPPFDEIPLKVKKVRFPSGKVFSPSNAEMAEFILEASRTSLFEVQIYDVKGKFICNASEAGEEPGSGFPKWEWDGKNKHGKVVPFGIYILRFVADSREVSHNEAISIIK